MDGWMDGWIEMYEKLGRNALQCTYFFLILHAVFIVHGALHSLLC
jgi:hypothetical protein